MQTVTTIGLDIAKSVWRPMRTVRACGCPVRCG